MGENTLEHVVIVGGAIMGSFCAWSLRDEGFTGSITVIEKDATYQFSSTALSAASIRVQFGTPLNTIMSLYGANFFRNIALKFGPDADIGYVENGYLILGRPDQVNDRNAAVQMQCDNGADILALGPEELSKRFPGFDFSGVGIGTFGARDEGWFDAWSLLSLVRSAGRKLDVKFVEADVERIETAHGRTTGVRLSDGTNINCDLCILAAGASSGRLVEKIGIDLPVVPKKRTVFCFQAPFKMDRFPMLFDSSGIWIRPEGDGFIGGIQPKPEGDHDADGDFEPHHDYMEELFWPLLAARIPAMEQLRLNRAWAGHYEVNTFDHNGIVGPHDEISNLIFATGFSGHGVMHAPAVGRGVAEWITTGGYRTIDMSPLSWDRIPDNKPMIETVVY